MRIHRSTPAGDFLTIPNETLRDERLSFAARGHLAYLLSRPDGWKTSADDEAERATRLRNKRGEGREAMRRVYRELKEAGYIQVVRSAAPDGRWTSETHVYDRPFSEFSQVAPTYGPSGVGTPVVGTPGVGSPGVGSADRRFTRTSRTKTEEEDREQAADQDQGPPVRNPEPRRVPDGPGMVADDAHHFPLNDAESTTAGSTRTRAEKPRKSAA